MLKWSFAAGRWLAQIAFGVSGFFFFFDLVAKWHESWHVQSLCLFIGPIERKKMWPSSLFTASILIIIISTHSLYEKGGGFFFKF